MCVCVCVVCVCVKEKTKERLPCRVFVVSRRAFLFARRGRSDDKGHRRLKARPSTK